MKWILVAAAGSALAFAGFSMAGSSRHAATAVKVTLAPRGDNSKLRRSSSVISRCAIACSVARRPITTWPSREIRLRPLAAPLPAFAERNNRIRTEGTRNLLGAANAAHAGRVLAQGIAWTPPDGGDAVEQHERMVLDADGTVLRYGIFYGPGTFGGDQAPSPPRIHIDAAAQRTVELLEAPPGIVVITETVE